MTQTDVHDLLGKTFTARADEMKQAYVFWIKLLKKVMNEVLSYLTFDGYKGFSQVNNFCWKRIPGP